MPQFQFRVTEESDERIRELTLWIRSNSNALMIVKEIGSETEKKHIHALIDVPNKSTFVQKFHKQFRKSEDGKFVPRYSGNKSYSCEELKKPLDNSLRYLCKGEKKGEHPNIEFSKYDAHEIIDFHNRYWDENASVKKPVVKAQKSALSWSHKVLSDYKDEYAHHIAHIQWCYSGMNNLSVEDCLDEKLVLFQFILKRCGQDVRKVNDHIILDIYKGFLNNILLGDEKAFKAYSSAWFDKLIMNDKF